MSPVKNISSANAKANGTWYDPIVVDEDAPTHLPTDVPPANAIKTKARGTSSPSTKAAVKTTKLGKPTKSVKNNDRWRSESPTCPDAVGKKRPADEDNAPMTQITKRRRKQEAPVPKKKSQPPPGLGPYTSRKFLHDGEFSVIYGVRNAEKDRERQQRIENRLEQEANQRKRQQQEDSYNAKERAVLEQQVKQMWRRMPQQGRDGFSCT